MLDLEPIKERMAITGTARRRASRPQIEALISEIELLRGMLYDIDAYFRHCRRDVGFMLSEDISLELAHEMNDVGERLGEYLWPGENSTQL